MAKQSSRMYGIKIKEKVNYYEFSDIKISFDTSTNKWTVISNYNDLWMNGIKYLKGETVFDFTDGYIGTFRMMARYPADEPGELYNNYLYYVSSDVVNNPKVGDMDITYKITTNDNYSLKVYRLKNGLISSEKIVDEQTIVEYKRRYEKQYPVFNLLFDWHGMDPQSGYPQMSFTCISNSNYIKDMEGNTKHKNTEIRTWQANTTVNFELKDETNKHQAKLQEEDVPVIHLSKQLNMHNVMEKDLNRNTIYHDVYYDHKDAYYNGYHHKAMWLVYDNASNSILCWRKRFNGLAITYADPYWMLMTYKSGFEINNRLIPAKTLLHNWKNDEEFHATYRQVTHVKKPNVSVKAKNFDKIVYDILQENEVITVTRLLNDEETDSQTITTEDTKVIFYNIEFRLLGTTWTIFSKCDYISYGSRTYTRNQSILDFGSDEEVHIHINDNTDKYEKEIITIYHVDTIAVDEVKYKIWTETIGNTLKVERTFHDDSEPWVTIHYYDAMVSPFEYEDLTFVFDNPNATWYLYSGSDSLYSDGTNYKDGELISSWGYLTPINFNHISCYKNSETGIKITYQDSTYKYKGLDLDEEIISGYNEFPEMRVKHSSAKGLWEICSEMNELWMDGVQYPEGSLVFSVKDKVIVDEFTITARHTTQIPYYNVLFKVSFNYNPIENITSISISASHDGAIINSWEWNDKDTSESVNKFLAMKDKMKSMYGYIWKRWTDPGPTPSLTDLMFLVYKQSTSSSGYSGAIVRYDYTTHSISTFGTYYFSRYSYIPYEDTPYNPNSKSIRLFIKQSRTNYYTLRNLIYTDNGVAGVTAVRDFNGYELGSMYYEDITTLVCIDYQYIEDLQEYRVVLEKFSIGPTGSKTLVHKTVYPNTPSHGYKVINNFGSKYITVHTGSNHTEIVIVDIESDTCLRIQGVNNLNNPTQVTSDVWDYLSAAYYPRYSGKAGRPEPDDPPHVDGYSWGLSEPSERDYGAKYVFNTNNFVLLNAVLTVTYRQWTYYQEFDYWSYRDTIYKKGLLAIKYDGSSFTCVESSDTDIMYNAMTKYEHSSVSDGEIWYEFRDDGGGIDGPSKYTYDNECYIIVRTCLRQSSYVDETQNFLICKLDKSSGLFNVERTLQPDHFVMVPMYDSSGSFIDNVKVKIGGSGSYYDTANKEIKVCYTRWSHGFVRLVGDSPTSRKDGILLRCVSNSSGTGYAYYIFMDNPYFDTSIGNFIIRY